MRALPGTCGLPVLPAEHGAGCWVIKRKETDRLSELVAAVPLPPKDACPETVEGESLSVERRALTQQGLWFYLHNPAS